MNVKCEECQTRYDDALQSTICPHLQFISSDTAKRKDEAIKLIGKEVYFAHMPNKFFRVQAVSFDGMVSVSGLSGEFAPHIFKVRES